MGAYVPITRQPGYERGRALADQQSFMDQFRNTPWLKGSLIEDVELAAGNTDVTHGLGRSPYGWWLVGFSGAAASDYPREASKDDALLTLTVTNAVTVSLWVY